MSELAPLAVAVPLLVAALLVFAQPFLGRAASDTIAIATAVASTTLALLLLVHVGHGISVYWFGGWHPRAGVAIGVDFAVDAIGAGLAAFVSLLMVLALIFSARRLEVQHPYYHVLMLTFMAGMVGFCLSGDLFNMFVFFELMSVSAVALVGYKVHEQAGVEGGLNFAVINTLGAFLFLLGIGVIYARTGALNLAQIGVSLAHSGNDRVVVAAFALIACALLVKAAAVPFHFWLADAYAVALTPVCLLLAGAMSELGLYGLARIWFSAFQPVLVAHADVIRAILIGLGILTALWGALMALAEDHLKRMLAFVTVSFIGVFLTGVGLLSVAGAAGTAVYVLADGFGKALLFACVGIVQHRTGRLSVTRLRGRGRAMPVTGALFLFGGLMIASLPPFGPFLGKSMIEDAALKAGYPEVPALMALASGIAGAAVLAAGAVVFLGWGDQQDAEDDADDATEPETSGPYSSTPLSMRIPAVALAACAAGVGVWFGFGHLATDAAERLADFGAYRAAIMGGGSATIGTLAYSSPRWYDYLYCGGATLLALALASLALWGPRLLPFWKELHDGLGTLSTPLRRLHSGRIGDYTAALMLGVGVLGGLMTLTLR